MAKTNPAKVAKITDHVNSYLESAWQFNGQPIFYASDVVDILEAWERKNHPEIKELTIHEALDKNMAVIPAGDTRDRILKAMREFAAQQDAEGPKWIKAADEMPKGPGPFNCKVKDRPRIYDGDTLRTVAPHIQELYWLSEEAVKA